MESEKQKNQEDTDENVKHRKSKLFCDFFSFLLACIPISFQMSLW